MAKQKVLKSINAIGFKGMSNLPRPAADLVDKQTGLITPACLLNADIVGGNAIVRQGYSKAITLTAPHSLWSDGQVMFCVATGSATAQALYLVGTHSALQLTSLPDIVTPMSYVRIDDIVFMSSAYWKGIYDLKTTTIDSWGIDLPIAPDASLCDGALVPGHYRLCYTATHNGSISGNGTIVDIYWDSGNRGIRLNNLPSGAVVWITHPNGGTFVLATVESNIISSVYGVQPLPTQDVIPPPYLQCLRYAFGRIWGVSGKYVYYSEPLQYDRFKKGNIFRFDQDIVLLAPVTDGMFIASASKTSFLAGRDPSKMTMGHTVGVGAIPGTYGTGMVAGGGYQVSRKLSQIETAFWSSTAGAAMGVQGGHILYLTDGQNDLYPRSQGASLVRSYQGGQQIITTYRGPLIADSIPRSIDEALKIGRLS